MTRLLCATDELFLAHDPGAGHPEAPERLRSILAALDPLPAGAAWGTPRDATRAELERVHTPAYLDTLDRARGRSGNLDADTGISPRSVEAAVRAAGAAIAVTEAVLAGDVASGFALVRPPGHHAEAARAMGFCLLNNAAVAAAQALAAPGAGVERVLIVDWDVHHGNGTQHVFEERRDVMYMSSHRWPFYPGTGALAERGRGAGEGYTVNAPLPGGMGDGDYRALYEDVLAPLALAYRPDLVIVSAGFDPYVADPLGGMRVSEEGFAWLCDLWRRVAEESCDGRIVLVLEGGYDLGGLARSVRACAEILCGASAPQIAAAPSPAGARAAREAGAAASRISRSAVA